MLCSAEKISTAWCLRSLKFVEMGDRTPVIPPSLLMQVAEGVSVGRAVADGTEQGSEPVLCVHVFMGKVVFVLGVNPFFHPSQHLLTRCVHRATFSPQSETKYLDVVCSQQPSMDAKWVDGAKPLFKIRIHLDSTIYTQVSQTSKRPPAQMQRERLLCLCYS